MLGSAEQKEQGQQPCLEVFRAKAAEAALSCLRQQAF